MDGSNKGLDPGQQFQQFQSMNHIDGDELIKVTPNSTHDKAAVPLPNEDNVNAIPPNNSNSTGQNSSANTHSDQNMMTNDIYTSSHGHDGSTAAAAVTGMADAPELEVDSQIGSQVSSKIPICTEITADT